MSTFIKAGFWEKLCKPCKGYKGWLNLDELIQSFIPKPTYKVYTALLTQSGGTNFLGIYGPYLTIGVTYVIINDDGDNLWDFTNVGAPNNNGGTIFVATGTTPNSWGSGCYLEYNTGAPVVTVLENTIGNVWFNYNDIGYYRVNSNGLFILGKTWNTNVIALGVNGPTYKGVLYQEDSSLLGIQTESDIDTTSNNILTNTPIEIRVYS